MNSIEQDAIIEVGFIYKSILDEADLSFPIESEDPAELKINNSNKQLFINAHLKNQLEDAYRQLFFAQRKVAKASEEVIKERNEEILFLALKGYSQKDLEKKYGLRQPSINKILKKTINVITGNEYDMPVLQLIRFNKDTLDKYFIHNKLKARHEARINNNSKSSVTIGDSGNIGNGTFG